MRKIVKIFALILAMISAILSLNAPNQLSKITDAIDFCHASGKESKRIVYVDLNRNMDIRLYNNDKKGFASIDLNLSDNSKEITSSFDCNALNENIHLSKGFNRIAVKWDEDSNVIEVNRLI